MLLEIMISAPATAGRLFHDTVSDVVALENDFDFASAEFAALFARSPATAFQHPLWLAKLYRHLVPGRVAERLVITIRREGTLVGLLPMIRRRVRGVVLVESTDLGVSDYSAPIVDPDWTADAACRARIVAALQPFDWLRVRPVRAEHLDAWRSLIGGDVQTLGFSAHAADVSGGFARWRAGALEPNYAKYLDRRKNRFFKGGRGELRQLEDRDEIVAAVAATRRLRAGRFQDDPIQTDFVESFYADVAVEGSTVGMVRAYALVLNGEPAAYVFGLCQASRFSHLLIGCDYQRHKRHSPGLVCYDAIIEAWANEGGTVFDFTIGDEKFKSDFGALPTPMFMLTQAPSMAGKLARAAFNARAQMRRKQPGAAKQ